MLVSALALLVLVRLADWPQVLAAWESLSIAGVGAAWVLFVVSMLTRVLAWRAMLQNSVPFGRALLALNEGYLLNTVFPLRAGELGRAILLGEYVPGGIFFVLSTIVIERAFDLALAAAVLLSTLPLAFAADWAAPAALTTLAAVAAALVLLYLTARYRARWAPRLRRLLERWPRLGSLLWPRLEATLDGFSLLTHPRWFALALGGMALTWALAVAEYAFVLRLFLPQAPLWWGAFVLGAAAAGVALPSAPGSLGVFEAAVVGALTLLGAPAAPALAYAVLVHLLHLLTTSALGAYALFRDGETLSKLWEKTMRHQR